MEEFRLREDRVLLSKKKKKKKKQTNNRKTTNQKKIPKVVKNPHKQTKAPNQVKPPPFL